MWLFVCLLLHTLFFLIFFFLWKPFHLVFTIHFFVLATSRRCCEYAFKPPIWTIVRRVWIQFSRSFSRKHSGVDEQTCTACIFIFCLHCNHYIFQALDDGDLQEWASFTFYIQQDSAKKARYAAYKRLHSSPETHNFAMRASSSMNHVPVQVISIFESSCICFDENINLLQALWFAYTFFKNN